MTPTAQVNHLASLLTCERLGVEGYCQRSAYDAKCEFDERVRELIADGRLMAWAQCAERAELAERTRRFA